MQQRTAFCGLFWQNTFLIFHTQKNFNLVASKSAIYQMILYQWKGSKQIFLFFTIIDFFHRSYSLVAVPAWRKQHENLEQVNYSWRLLPEGDMDSYLSKTMGGDPREKEGYAVWTDRRHFFMVESTFYGKKFCWSFLREASIFIEFLRKFQCKRADTIFWHTNDHLTQTINFSDNVGTALLDKFDSMYNSP